MGFNKKVLSKAVSELGKAKAPAKPKDIITDPAGQWKYPGQKTRIPGNDITMQGVPYPVWAQPNVGKGSMMQPNQDYNFPGASYVDETPMAKKGGSKLGTINLNPNPLSHYELNYGFNLPTKENGGEADYEDQDLTDEEIQALRDAGYEVEELPKAQNGLASSPEEWGKEIKTIERQIGNPKKWTLEGYNLLQNKLNDYKNWRENTPEGQAVIDSHNVAGEYNVPVPEHLSGIPYNTTGPRNEVEPEAIPVGTKMSPDYDLKRFYTEDPMAAETFMAGKGHATDKYKLPNHPTFSNQSMYNSTDTPGGEWIENEDGAWSFNASQVNRSNMSNKDLKSYFDEVEPGNTLNYNPIKKQGGFVQHELVKAQKGKTVKPYYTSDPKKYAFKKAAYDDSLYLYNSSFNDYNNIKKFTNLNQLEDYRNKTSNNKFHQARNNLNYPDYEKVYELPGINYRVGVYKKPVQPVKFVPKSKPKPADKKILDKNGYTPTADYLKKYPPIYISNPKDARIGLYSEAGNIYVYKPKPAVKVNTPKPKKPVIHNIYQEPIEEVTPLKNIPYQEFKRPEQQIIPAPPYVKPIRYSGPRYGTQAGDENLGLSDDATQEQREAARRNKSATDFQQKNLEYQQQEKAKITKRLKPVGLTENFKEGGSSEQKIIFSPEEGGCPVGQYWTGTECKIIPKNTKIVYSQDELNKSNVSKKEQQKLYNQYISRINNHAAIDAGREKVYGNKGSKDKYYKTFESIPKSGFDPMMSYGTGQLIPNGLAIGVPALNESMVNFSTWKKMMDKSSIKPIGFKGNPGGGHFYPVYEKPSNYLLGYNKENVTTNTDIVPEDEVTPLKNIPYQQSIRPEYEIIPATPYVKPVHYAGPRHGTWSDGSKGQFPQGLNTSDWERKTKEYQQQQRGAQPVVTRKQGGILHKAQTGEEFDESNYDYDYDHYLQDAAKSKIRNAEGKLPNRQYMQEVAVTGNPYPEKKPDMMQATPEQSNASRAWEYITNPLTAAEYAISGGGAENMPHNINEMRIAGIDPGVVEGRNLVGNTLNSTVNLFDAGDKVVRNIGEGNYGSAFLEGLRFIPGSGLLDDAVRLGVKPGVKYLGKTYNKVATGNSVLPYAWKSEAIGLTDNASKQMFDKLLNSNKLTNEERAVLIDYHAGSRNYTGRHGAADQVKQDELNKIIQKYNLYVPDDVILTRKFNPENNSLGADINEKVLDFKTRPTSFSAGVGQSSYTSGAVDRLVIPSKYSKSMGNQFIKSDYSPLSEKAFEEVGHKINDIDFAKYNFSDDISHQWNNSNSTLSKEKEIIGTGLKLKKIGKVKNDIGGYDHIVKPVNTSKIPVKSRWYNNGKFDMTNPNIYKAAIPLTIGTGAALNQWHLQPATIEGGFKYGGILDSYQTKGEVHADEDWYNDYEQERAKYESDKAKGIISSTGYQDEVTVTPAANNRQKGIQVTPEQYKELERKSKGEKWAKQFGEQYSTYESQPWKHTPQSAGSADWFWTLPFAAPAAIEGLGALAAKSLPFMSAVPGATWGNAANAAFIANSLYNTPKNVGDWYDVSQGKKNWKDAALGTAEIAAGLIGSGAGFKSLAQDVTQGGKYLGSKIDKVIYPTRTYRAHLPGGNETSYEVSELAKKINKKGDWTTKDLVEAQHYLKGTEAFGGKRGLLTGDDMLLTEYKVPFWKKNVSYDKDVTALKKLQDQAVNSNEFIIPNNKFLYPRRTNLIKAVPEEVKTFEELLPNGNMANLYNPGSFPLGPNSYAHASKPYKYIEDQINAVTGHNMPLSYKFDGIIGNGKVNAPLVDWKQPRFAPNAGIGKFNGKTLPNSANVDFSKYLTQEEAVAARSERLISQKNKPGWNEQLTPDLEQRLANAVENHNPASEYAGEKLGSNTGGRSATEVSRHPMNADKLNPNSRTYDPEAVPIYLNDANKARVAAHETGHYYANSPEEGAEWLSHFDFSKLPHKARTYLRGKRFSNADEIRERAAQLKDYIAQKNGIPLNQDFEITQAQLDDAIANYVKDTGLDNSMSKMLGALKDKKGLLKTMNKYALGTIPAVIGAQTLSEEETPLKPAILNPGFKYGGATESWEDDLTDDEINALEAAGFIVEDVNSYQVGGGVSDTWEKVTGTSWDTAKQKGYTSGSYNDNINLLKQLNEGKFNSINKTVQPVINEKKVIKVPAEINTQIKTAKSFNEAFGIARNTMGPNQIFEYNGRKYGTNQAGETFKPSEEVLKASGLNSTKVKERLNKQNTDLNSPYLNKKTVKLQPDEYISWDKVKTKNIEINKNDNAQKIIDYNKNRNSTKNYVIVDKKKGLMHIYAPGNSKPLFSSAVDLGESRSDAQTTTKVKDTNGDGIIDKKEAQIGKADFSKGNKSTGAGKYYISNIDAKGYEGLPLFNMMSEAQYDAYLKTGKIDNVATSFHKGYVADDVNRVSNGCIRCNKTTLDNLTKYLKNSSEVYILPEDDNNNFVYENGKLNFQAKHKTNLYTYKNNGNIYKKENNVWYVAPKVGSTFKQITDPVRVKSLNTGATSAGYNFYEDSHKIVQQGQGVNKSTNTLNYIPIKTTLDEATFKKNNYKDSTTDNEKLIDNSKLLNVKTYVDALATNKQKIMKATKINGDVYNELAKMSFGILGTESNYADIHTPAGNFGRAVKKYLKPTSSSSPDYYSKYYTYGVTDNSNSVGLTQIRWSYLNASEKAALKELGITSNKDFMDPKKAAIGTTAILAIRYNEQLNTTQKQDVWKYLPTKWNTRDNYASRVKNNSRYMSIAQQNKNK